MNDYETDFEFWVNDSLQREVNGFRTPSVIADLVFNNRDYYGITIWFNESL